MAIATEIVSSFVEPLEQFIDQGAGNLASALEGPLTTGAVLYIVIFGIMILLGYVRSPISDFVINVIKISILVALVTQVSNYNQYVTDLFFTQIPDGLSTAIGSVSPGAVNPEQIKSGAGFDAIIDRAIIMGEEIASEGSWNDIYPYIVSAVFTVVALLVAMILLAIYLFAKVASALVLVLGPLFIAMLLFRSTQTLFSSWLAAVLNFVLLQILTVALLTLLISLINSNIQSASGQNPGMQMVYAWRMAGLFALSLYLGLQLPEIAARMSGGGLALGGGLSRAAIDGLKKIPGAGGAAARVGGAITKAGGK
ncbi:MULTISPECIES: type IV secretion system protein [Agrobacterium]|uniref:Type IV secretion system protein n=1 Tax=Agrobacterium larrymoorei TaxID=160699 RepID=A0ABX8TC79_9HYPH|nr:type IV secretion system protein [Agrobacterium larrymoorei]NSZ10057.1 type IV secretion system protein [Agrobacterium tumefaciens]QYA10859.1 type IV secretion system protein [Agrobacterium larrymoorei]